MARFNVTIVWPGTSDDAAAFSPTAVAVAAALRELGHEVTETRNRIEPPPWTNVLFGWNLVASADWLDGRRVILWQLEHLDVSVPWTKFLAILAQRSCAVWDFDAAGRDTLRTRLGVPGALCVPLGHHAALATVPPGVAPDHDAVFFGARTPRREAMVAACRAAGLTVEWPGYAWGPERDAIVARSRVVIASPSSEWHGFDQVRASQMLASGRLLVAETAGRPWAPAWARLVRRVPFDRIAATAAGVARLDGWARTGAQAAVRDAFARYPLARSLAMALDGADAERAWDGA